MGDVLAIDLGNSEVKFGLVDAGISGSDVQGGASAPTLRAEAHVPTDRVRTLRSGADLVAAAGLGTLVAGLPPVALGSVVSWAGARIAALMTDLGCAVYPVTSLGFTASEGFGFRIDYEHGEPGVDRVAACAEAFARSGGPLILVGAGTALHTNAVTADGVYLGGAIMPGLRLMSAALGGGTDQVRSVEPREPRRVIGHSTPECAEIGIYYAWLGGALRLVEATRDELAREHGGGEPFVWLTGGHSTWLLPFLPGAQADPHLALFGLARAFARTREAGDEGSPSAPEGAQRA